MTAESLDNDCLDNFDEEVEISRGNFLGGQNFVNSVEQ